MACCSSILWAMTIASIAIGIIFPYTQIVKAKQQFQAQLIDENTLSQMVTESFYFGTAIFGAVSPFLFLFSCIVSILLLAGYIK